MSGFLFHGYIDSSYKQARGDLTDVLIFFIVGMLTSGLLGFFASAPFLTISRFTGRLLDIQSRRSRLRYFSVLLSLLFIPSVLSIVASLQNSIQVRATFERRLGILRPHVSQVEADTFFEKWLRVETRDDFWSLDQEMVQAAAKAHISFPAAYGTLF